MNLPIHRHFTQSFLYTFFERKISKIYSLVFYVSVSSWNFYNIRQNHDIYKFKVKTNSILPKQVIRMIGMKQEVSDNYYDPHTKLVNMIHLKYLTWPNIIKIIKFKL